jgi:hypothetical protein
VIEGAPINGGYYLFTPKFWLVASSLSASTALENEPLEQLAAEGSLRSHLDRLVDFEGFGQIVGLPAVFDIEQRYR